MAIEIERKYIKVNLDDLYSKLRNAGAKHYRPHLESNIVFDTPDKTLMNTGRYIRLRTQTWNDTYRHILTYKQQAEGVAGFKVKEEHEIYIDVKNYDAILAMLKGLGYLPHYRYEKVRDPWELNNVAIDIDTLPFMEAVELEGNTDSIEEVEKLLGLENAVKNTSSYSKLHIEWLKEMQLPETGDFVFLEEQKKQICDKYKI